MKRLLVTFGLLGASLGGCTSPDTTQRRVHAQTLAQLAERRSVALPPHSPAPDFRLMDPTGRAVALRDFRGKVVYLDFWYSGCRPCLAEAPAADKLKAQFRGQDVAFVCISTETNVEGWRQAVEKYALGGSNSVHLLDPEGKYAARPYRVEGFPTYTLIGRDGRIWQTEAPRPSDGKAAALAVARALQGQR